MCIYILTTFWLCVIMRMVKGRIRVMQFSGYQGIWCVYATSLFIIWQIVSTSNVGHLQAFVHITKSELGVTGNIDAHSHVTQTGMLRIKKKRLSLTFLHVLTSTRSPSGRYIQYIGIQIQKILSKIRIFDRICCICMP
jgi:hypothetical protein